MAVFKRKCRGFEIKINDVDHAPPHCHVDVAGRNRRIGLWNLVVLGPPVRVPAALRKCLRTHRAEMLRAWERVKFVDSGRLP